MTTVATKFHALTDNDLLDEIFWLQEQPVTLANSRAYNQYRNELQRREMRRQYLVDHLG